MKSNDTRIISNKRTKRGYNLNFRVIAVKEIALTMNLHKPNTILLRFYFKIETG